jgi:mono/diheme cytochrome c family protein
VLGYLLAHGSGNTGPLLGRHMWAGILLCIGTLLCVLARPSWASGAVHRIYPGMLACDLLILIWTAHQGGSITHGTGYLTENMPAPVKRLFGAGSDTSTSPDSFYSQRIHPIFDSNCVSCHGAAKSEAGLRLDSFTSLMQGGKDGAVIVPGNPEKSLLIQRVTLPPTDKHFMPAEGRPPLRPEETALIAAWIRDGASPTATAVAGIKSPERSKEPPPQPVGDYSALMPEIRHMQTSIGAKVVPVSSNLSDGLVLHTSDGPAAFGDAQLAQFSKFAPYIVEAELGRTAVTDASFVTLATFTHLRALHLEGTAITGSGLVKLAPLSQLTYLNLSATKVTQSAVAPLASMKHLRHIYLFDTPAQPAPPPDPNPPATQPSK